MHVKLIKNKVGNYGNSKNKVGNYGNTPQSRISNE